MAGIETLNPGRGACREFHAELSAYLEGESRPGVSGHARECPYCAAVLADLELIRGEARGLPLESPPPGLWSRVRADLAADGLLRQPDSGAFAWFRQFAWLRYAAPAATMAGLVLAALASLVPPAERGSESATAKGAAAPVAVAEITPQGRPLPGEQLVLARTVEDLEKAFTARRSSFEPALQVTYQKGLKSLDDSIRECQESINSEPSNTLAQDYLLAAYSQKAELLESALESEGR